MEWRWREGRLVRVHSIYAVIYGDARYVVLHYSPIPSFDTVAGVTCGRRMSVPLPLLIVLGKEVETRIVWVGILPITSRGS